MIDDVQHVTEKSKVFFNYYLQQMKFRFVKGLAVIQVIPRTAATELASGVRAKCLFLGHAKIPFFARSHIKLARWRFC